MDPASAIGIAAAAVQFFTIGVKAIRVGRQICVSKTGTTEAYEALESSLKAISDIRRDLRHDLLRNADSNIAKTQRQCLVNCKKALEGSREHQSVFSACQVQVSEACRGDMAGHEIPE